MAGRRKPREHPMEYSILLTATLCLLALGAVMVYSASSARAVLSGTGDPTQFLIRYMTYGAIGLALMWWLSGRYKLAALTRMAGPFLAVSFVLLLLVQTPMGVEVNGAKRWLGAGPLIFQPSELMKLALLLYAVKLLTERPKMVRSLRTLAPLGIVVAGALGLVAMQPDLGTALVIAGTLGALVFVAGIPMRLFGLIAGAGAGLVILFAMSASYRRDRLMTFLDPWKHAADEGFQAVQGLIALGSGGFVGQGIGQGQAKNLFLPEAHTDFILANIGEELGVVGICGVLFLYTAIAYAGLKTAKGARGRQAKLLAAGVTSLILTQALLNVFAVLGMAPLTGVPLPLISYGSTNLVVMLCSIGLLLNIARGQAVQLRVVKESPRGAKNRDRSRRNSGARSAGAGGRRRAAG
jgi:cell division protein FtsW